MSLVPRAPRSTATPWVRLPLLLAALFAACGDGRGDSDGPTGVADASDARRDDGGQQSDARADLPPDKPIPAALLPASPFAGLWVGKTGQDLPASLVVAEDGTVTDLTLRFQLEYPDGGWCAAEFTPATLPVLLDGQARSELSTTVAALRIPLDLRFTSATTAAGTYPGYSGAYDINCNGRRRMDSGPLVPSGQLQLERVLAPPAAAAGDRLLMNGQGSPVPLGSCNHAPGSKARVCAFARLKSVGLGELWVADLDTPAGRACVDVTSNQPQDGCLRLSESLVLGTAASPQGFPTFHRFQGDTLIFRERPSGGVNGPMLAWRPGWAAAVKLVDRGNSCDASDSGEVVACLAAYDGSVTTGPAFADLWAGRLGDGTAPLTKVTRLMVVSTADRALPTLPSTYNYAVSPDGQEVLWSARLEDSATAVQTLSAAALSALAAPRTVATDVTRWRFSRDGRHLFWLRAAVAATEIAPAQGDLEKAPFPPGPVAVPSRSFGRVQEFVELAGAAGAEPLLILAPDGQLLQTPLVGPPRVVDTQVLAIRALSPDSSRVTYAKTLAAPASLWGDLYVASLAGPERPCWVGTDPDLVLPVFSSSSNHLVVGRDVEAVTNDVNLMLVDARTCQKVRQIANVRNWQWLPGDRFLIATRNLPLRRFGLVSLQMLEGPQAEPRALVDVASGSWGIRIIEEDGKTRVDLMYGLNAGWRSDGIYQRTIVY